MMLLCVSEYILFSEKSQSLIEKARAALDTLHYVIEEDDPYIGHVSQTVSALIYASPLRLDFKATSETDEFNQAFISPAGGYVLTDGLFDGETFAADFLAILERDIEDYRRYLRDES